MKKLLFISTMLLTLCTNAQKKDETSIKELLDRQTKAWNSGNLDSFMVGYWNSDSLVFIGKNGPKYGYNITLANYKKSYPDTAAMGMLTFTLLEIKRLSPDYYFVIGKWHLTRSAGNLQGHYSLLLRKINRQWVIVADHSS